MITKIDLSGEWTFTADEKMLGTGPEYIKKFPTDTIFLPSTTSLSGKGVPNTGCEEYHLTDVYPYEGYAWFSKTVEIGGVPNGGRVQLFLERTRITDLWVNGKYAGSCNSLCTSHIYDITPFISDGKAELCIRVCNTGYPTKGGHMTSPDTQTNWNGITGELSLRLYESKRISRIRAFPDVANKTIELEITLDVTDSADVNVWGASSDGNIVDLQTFSVSSAVSRIKLNFGENISLWSAETPVIYTLKAAICGSSDIFTIKTGLREFSTNGIEFTINGEPVFLRGKHDAMVFPLTGAAPTTFEEWYNVFITAKSWGINHYRFHTCCPPEAAFAAADIAGIYLQPELPFWGDIAGEENEELSYLIAEGKRILDEFGDHPSFVMFSLGNELWGNKNMLTNMLRELKDYDPRHLYTQGSNNFQFAPEILPYDDFFSGVRFDRERLIRGSYGACDKPYGFIQSEQPNTFHSYDNTAFSQPDNEKARNIPVITHEIGQYSVFPDIDERKKYTGPLKARYMNTYEDRLQSSGMFSYADKLHEASGMLAFNCYKLEIEAAMRSRNIAGFQLLDLQDFPGQCVALVGMLDPFMAEKKFVRRNDLRRKWNGFCSDIVILAEFSTFVVKCGETVAVSVWIRNMSGKAITDAVLKWDGGSIKLTEDITGLYHVGEVRIKADKTGEFTVYFQLYDVNGTLLSENSYYLWAYPEKPTLTELPSISEYNGDNVYITSDLTEAESLLGEKKKVLYLPNSLREALDGTYCTDFWSYPMFRYISENNGCEPPIGTLGLLIDNEHPALKGFDCRCYSTPQWYNIVNGVKCAVLDGTPEGYRPIVQMIDNSERCHKLGILYEVKVGDGRLMICTSRPDIAEFPETAVFFKSILDYMHSESFEPKYELALEELDLR